ncbi:RND efflux membrane fusion protein [Oceaniferula spumae]|uniref:RND efflux membrane fusion protein n=1 Tax=Oceaniferula spumae TaxID=2979115 RepID=A0AAT9FI49_9BACT
MDFIKQLNRLPLLATCVTLAACSGKEDEPEKKSTAITVEVVPASRGNVQTWTFGEGTARATRREYLNFENAGRITYIKPDLREGSEVKEGEVLVRQDQRRPSAEVDSSKASVAEAKTRSQVAAAELNQAETEQKLAKTTFQRFKTLLEKKSASRQEYDEAKAKADNAASSVARAKSQVEAAASQVFAAEAKLKQAEVGLETTELRAPISGVIARLNVVEGFYMMPNLVRTDSEESFLQTVPILIIDRESLEITVDIPPALRGTVAPKQLVFIQPGGGGGGDGPDKAPDQFPARGEVYSVTPSVSPGKRTIQVKIRTTAGAEKLQDGTFCTVWIATDKSENVVIAPIDAFVYRDNKPHVFVVEGDQAKMRAVELGLRGLDGQEITSGVKQGELLVTTGRYQLSDGAPVKTLKASSEESNE